MSSAFKGSSLSANRPFPGLRPYRFEDHEFFFGRENQIYSLYGLFDHSRFIAVVGSSGSGKSSLVRAGLLPRLDEESWKRVEFHPGDTPIGNLASAMASQLWPNDDPSIAAAQRERIRFALRRSSFGISDALREIASLGDASIILVVDQFEELFRYSTKQQISMTASDAQRDEEAKSFVQLLLAASRDRALNVYVLLTMRSDFIGDCANFPGLPEAVSASQFLVPSLSRDQREEVIQQPIEKAHATIEPELVQQLLNDSSDDIDQLPVLQHCLLRVWEAAGTSGATADGAGRRLTLRHYQEDVGGIAHALSNHADEILRELSSTGLAVEQLFRSIAEIDGEGRIVRRACLFKQLLAETGIPAEDLRTVADRFRDDDCSFLTPPKSEVTELIDDTRIDVGHEALLRRWERISGDTRTGAPYIGWLRAEVADGRTYRGLLAMAESKSTIGADTVEERWKRWNERPRTAAWAERYGGHLEEVEQLFKESLATLEAQRDRDRRQAELQREQERQRIEDAAERRRMQSEAAAARRAVIVVCCFLLAAVGLGAFSYLQWRSAAQQTAVAQQQKATALANLVNSIVLVTNQLQQIQALLDSGQITVDVAKQFLTSADATSTQFEAAEQTPVIMASRAWLLVAFADTYLTAQDNITGLKAARDAQRIAERLVALDPTNESSQFLLYSAYFNGGDLEDALYHAVESLRDYNAALSIAQDWVKKDSTGYRWLQRVAFIMNKLGDAASGDQALKIYQSALAINQKLADAHPDIGGLQRDLANTLMRVGDAEAENNPEDARAKYNAALSIRLALVKSNPDDRGLQSNLATTYNHLAGIKLRQGDLAGAAELHASALAIRQSLIKSDPGNVMWQTSLAREYADTGNMLLLAKPDYDGAIENFRSALTIRQALVDLDPSNDTWSKNLATSYGKLAAALVAQADASLQQGQNAAAIALYQNALSFVQAFISSHPGNAALNGALQTITQKIKGLTPNSP
jgi:tetratricopeptide (TPR) repeat protein